MTRSRHWSRPLSPKWEMLFEKIRSCEDAYFGSPATDEELALAQRELRLGFPAGYLAFQETLGLGSFAGQQLCGICLKDGERQAPSDIVAQTLDHRREFDLPQHLVLIADDGMGGQYALDASKGSGVDDAPVHVWHPGPRAVEHIGENFFSLLVSWLWLDEDA